MKRFRKVVFRVHLCVGVVAGLIIGLLCLTGAVLAFEDDFIAAAEKDSVILELAAAAERKAIDELVRMAQEAEPDAIFSQIVIASEPSTAWRLNIGRRDFRYLNPYTGEIWQSEAQGLRDFFFFNFELHRWLVLQGDSRDTGRMITNVANLGFLFLCLSGLYLWFPRVWRWKAFRAVLMLKRGAKGKARDFNWHNVFGFWALIPLILMILTGAYFYYDWAKAGARGLLGPSAPRPGTQLVARGAAAATSGAPLSMQARFDVASAWSADWEEITMPIVSSASRGRRAAGRGIGSGAGRGSGLAPGGGTGGQGAGDGSGPGGAIVAGSGPGAAQGGGRRGPSVDPAVVLVQEAGQWFPYNRPSELLVDLHSGVITAQRQPSDLSLREKLHSSLRYIHTGEAGLLPGKIIAFLGCFAGLILVYSGFALSYRRLMSSRRKKTAS
ncbi:PepSY-associated TM helix domain-containing protein [Coraliomargarita sp. SDUM461004]|uniref:PepSY-associated TM helix domain-containing protein n=1 Tax=Thalassobacterium sedimentorum TaxID=3041258 RepID=A0ABU1AJH1_9BACT|nr:PepSY-associated TM helix domain-containing protein [Coraliomargarita sp. SDUM461004]MDQ8194964.1 PepSY-associated TM helix domain-containing protein [Coraliomargarita sp. SDUM461004]